MRDVDHPAQAPTKRERARGSFYAYGTNASRGRWFRRYLDAVAYAKRVGGGFVDQRDKRGEWTPVSTVAANGFRRRDF